MTDFQKRIIWLVDENKSELRTYTALLEKVLPESLEVVPVMAKPLREEYLDILENLATVAVILDQKLKDTGIARYSGTELARYLRGINSKLPIYILTNYANDTEEFVGSEWSVEDILAKEDFQDEDRTTIVIARLLRRIDVYQDVLLSREERFRALLAKSMQNELNKDEIEELEELHFIRSGPLLAGELTRIKELQQIIDANEELIRKLSATQD